MSTPSGTLNDIMLADMSHELDVNRSYQAIKASLAYSQTLSDRGPEPLHWIFKAGNSREYERSFSELLYDTTFQKLVDQRKKQGLRIEVMDLMGYGHALRDLSVDSGLAVALSDSRPGNLRSWDKRHNIDLMEGNVLRDLTWKRMSAWLEDHGAQGFDLILSRPLGGMGESAITNRSSVHYALLQRAWERLDRNHGTLFTQIPRMDKEKMHRFVGGLQDGGIETTYQEHAVDVYHAIKIVRKPFSPERLPVSPALMSAAA